ncbi:MAG: UDP-N-acetylglucosamine--N-acetylmuramyl-(pentapeptide) pyrophosphoryl-undecaprenol N-acetylglucosamine transferase [Clostridia bacterium]|nr:UDP-N-acetylglucosamine--N-acetylmuramyl-(pentapeptide) pyrophosphoryl-undecaprenol N-acetylglucosamine transferase [Clostridia bacterium]
MKTIVLTGGGTGGHIYPSLALLPKLKQHFENIFFIGGTGIERDIVERAGLPFYEVPTVKFDRSLSLSNFKIPCKLHRAVELAKVILKEIKPDIVFSKGGYASLPTVIAARKLNIEVVCHESDATLGLANKVAKLYGATVSTALFQTATQNKNFVYTGMPLREELFSISPSVAKSKINSADKPVLLVLGGSSGAVFLNKVVYSALDELTKKYFVVHISGKNGDFSVSSENYLQIEYSNQIKIYYAAADYVLSRAGATAVAELSALNKRTILVPLPKGNSRGDQLANAEFARGLGAKVIFQHDFSADVLVDALNSLNDAPPMRSIGKDANTAIVNLLIEKSNHA